MAIVIVTHHRPREVVDAIRSCLAQTVAPHSVTIVDNGNTLPASWSPPPSTHVPVEIRRIARVPLPAARNHGIPADPVDWVLFLDDDDVLRPEALERLLAGAAASPDAVVITGRGRRVLPDGTDAPDRTEEAVGDLTPLLRLTCPILTCGCAIIRRDALAAVGGWDDAVEAAEDYLLWLKLGGIGTIRGIDAVVLDYLMHPASMTRRGMQFTRLHSFARGFDRAFVGRRHRALRTDALDQLVRAHAEDATTNLLRLLRRGPLRSAISAGVDYARSLGWCLRSPRLARRWLAEAGAALGRGGSRGRVPIPEGSS